LLYFQSANNTPLDFTRVGPACFFQVMNSMSKPFLFKELPGSVPNNIPLSHRDDHDEKHAYFAEMMESMIQILCENAKQKPCSVLELGAGTGIFTKRLSRLPNVQVTAVEMGTETHARLLLNIGSSKSVEVLKDDCLKLDLHKQFDFVVSSFAAHTIQEGQKEQYFYVVRRHLKKDGLFIVGDEFLRDYDSTNKEERFEALKDYHHHIIEIARGENELILLELESTALLSGLLELGDFKVSTEIYERLLEKAGFAVQKKKIGPRALPDIGGVYVFTSLQRMKEVE